MTLISLRPFRPLSLAGSGGCLAHFAVETDRLRYLIHLQELCGTVEIPGMASRAWCEWTWLPA